jgi:valyl-tRNA synthetase
MLGDAGVAVHPADERFAGLVGRTVTVPLIGRVIPIVADDAVDPEFGTGAVKVTPAHDALDFEIAERQGLEPIAVIDEGGMITEAGGPYAGLDRYDARREVVAALEQGGYLIDSQPHTHSVGHCDRCKTAIEPFLSLQWFVRVAPLVAPAIEAVRSGEIRFVPETWEKSYFHWMENLRDWTISRQIWWGHRIPAWYCDACGEVTVSMEAPDHCVCGSTALRQDEDVLDTWFSSGLFPFSTLGWPEDTEDYRRFYPNSVLVTGFDIIYFWVARMIKLGIHFTGRNPFAEVIIHGMVRADDGRKMSKSLGNGIDPLDVVEVHGADALRLALIQAAAPGHDVPFQEEWVDAARRFGNKLWNAVRFAIGHLEVGKVPATGGYPEDTGPEARWILSRLAHAQTRVDRLLDEYRFNDAYATAYNFAWSEAFDWYIELTKAPLRDADAAEARQTLGVVLRDILKVFHPVMPYITEELWSHLVGEGFLAAADWPTPPSFAEPPHFEVFQELVAGVRRFRAEHGLAPRHPLELSIVDPAGVAADWWSRQFEALASVTPNLVETAPTGDHAPVKAGPVHGYISLAGVVDSGAERTRIDKEIAEARSNLEHAQRKLGNEEFVAKAPAAVVDKERARVDELQGVLAELDRRRADLGQE